MSSSSMDTDTKPPTLVKHTSLATPPVSPPVVVHRAASFNSSTKTAHQATKTENTAHPTSTAASSVPGRMSAEAWKASTPNCSTPKVKQRRTYFKEEVEETPRANHACPLEKRHVEGPVPSWGFPRSAVDIWKKNITSIHEWQRECLETTGVLNGASLIYSLPTSGGKTYVAEVLLMRMVWERKKIALFVLPFIAIVTEKVRSLKAFAKRLGFQVEGFYHNSGRLPVSKKPTLCICTIEKANLITSLLIEEGRIGELGLVVVDELHMLGQTNRGYLVEILGTKIKYTADQHSVQIVGMSATLPNLNDLAQWLNASYFYRNFRPVQLLEHVFDGTQLFVPRLVDPSDTAAITTLLSSDPSSLPPALNGNDTGPSSSSSTSNQKKSDDPLKPFYVPERKGELIFSNDSESEHVPHLSAESALAAFYLVRQLIPYHCALIFCSTRAMTTDMAKFLAKTFLLYPPKHKMSAKWMKWEPGTEDMVMRNPPDLPNLSVEEWSKLISQQKDERERLIMNLKMVMRYQMSDEMKLCLEQGVAWHNSELGTAERELLEEAFRKKVINVICCTSTLAAGVNMPARRVIIMNTRIGRDELGVSDYRQMVGRAGRAGIDVLGESFLFIQRGQKFVNTAESSHGAIRLLVEPIPPVLSALGGGQGTGSEFWTLRVSRNILLKRIRSEIDGFRTIDTAPILPVYPTLIDMGSLYDKVPVTSYFCAKDTETNSTLDNAGCGIDRLILEAVASRAAVTRAEVHRFIKCTFLATRKTEDHLNALIDKSLKFLTYVLLIESVTVEEATQRQENIRTLELSDLNSKLGRSHIRVQIRNYNEAAAAAAAMNQEGGGGGETKAMEMGPPQNRVENPYVVLVPTKFGMATYRTAFSIETALFMREEYEKALIHLTLRDDLQRCWMCIPTMPTCRPLKYEYLPWRNILKRLQKGPPGSAERLAAKMAEDPHNPHMSEGEEENVHEDDFTPLDDAERMYAAFSRRVGATYKAFPAKKGKSLEYDKTAAHPTERFMLALIMQFIVNENRVEEVAKRFSVSVGPLEGLMETCGSQAGQLSVFCYAMGESDLGDIFKRFAGRLTVGAKEDILPLMKIKGIKAVRARLLFEKGFNTVRSIAVAQVHEIADALNSGGSATTASKFATSVIRAAKELCDEAAKDLREAAKKEEPVPTPEPTPPQIVTRRQANKRSSSSVSLAASGRSAAESEISFDDIDRSLSEIDQSFWETALDEQELELLMKMDFEHPS